MRSLFCIIGLLLFSLTSYGQNDRKMIWNDEFDYSGAPNSTLWSFDLGNGCPELCGWGNKELQFYTDSSLNARVENGHLIIEAHKDDSLKYTSAKLKSNHHGAWKYGRFEVRAKLPVGRGTWPAIWMLPKDWKYGEWPKSGEIDIMEHVGFEQDVVHGTVHTESFNHKLGTQKGKSTQVKSSNEEFHVYAVEWDENGIAFYVDEVKYNYFSNTNNDYKEWPFDQPFYLILNLAVGGNWGGKEGIDDSIWPQKLVIDYVRVYSH